MPMLADRLARALAARGIHYGWVMVFIAFLNAVFSSSALGVPAVLMLPMAQDLGWTIGEMSAPQGLRLALFGLAAPFAGGLMLRYGPRRMLGWSGLLLLAGLALTVVMTERWQMWLGLGVILGIAPGLTAMQLGAVISSRWFAARRGLVVGLLSGAVATGTLIFMPLGAWLSENWGWRAALLPPFIGEAVSLVLFLLLAKDHPQELNLPPYGETAVAPMPRPSQENFVMLSFRALGLGVQRRVFWVLAFTFFICGATSFGLTQTHFVPFCGDLGVPIVAAAGLIAVIGICDLIGTIGSGWLSDRYDNRWLLGWYYGLRGVSLVWLVYADVSMLGLTIFAVIYGLDYIATVPPSVRLAITAFGRDMGPAVFAWIFAGHQLGAGLMAFGAGVSRDALESYVPAFLFAGVLCLLAAAAFMLVRKPAPATA
jgi:MFS family permease